MMIQSENSIIAAECGEAILVMPGEGKVGNVKS